jgi:hypothetical protein
MVKLDTTMFRKVMLALMLSLLLVAPAMSEDLVQHLEGSVPVYFQQTNGKIERFSRKNYAAFQEAFEKQFGWESSLHSTTDTHGYLVFSPNGSVSDPERIVYDIRVYGGGIVILGMHARFTGVRDDLTGDEMFRRTFGILWTP